MRADFQPHVHAEIRQRIHRRGKLHGLPHASAPMDGAARFTGATPAGDRAEERHRLRLRLEIGQRLLQFFGSGPHERMMERMIDPHESREDALRLQLGEHRLQRNARARPASANAAR